jgi:DNA adenine methylase
VLSYNDCSTVREWYADFRIVEVEWQYTLGQGETRIGKNRLENSADGYVKDSHELLIVKDA